MNSHALDADAGLMFQNTTQAAGISLKIDCEPLSTEIWIDRGMWEKIVPTLLSNAFKFTLLNSITVRVSESESHAVLEVIDTGVGIPAGEVTRVFDRFHRVVGASGRTHEGAGIGLALTRALVELHGGRITASNRAGTVGPRPLAAAAVIDAKTVDSN